LPADARGCQLGRQELHFIGGVFIVPIRRGGRASIRQNWLRQTLGAEWRHHGSGGGRNHVARFMFRLRMEAKRFEAAWKANMFRQRSKVDCN
jgi:hypothetical protein